jgi:very-short-patch-repair endonuclease
VSDARRIPCLQGTQNVEHPDRALAELASEQHGVVARRQLALLGLTDKMVVTRVRRGLLVRLHRGVYAVGHDRLRREGRWLAAVLAVGPGALLSHRDAAALHGLLPPGDHARWEVTTTGRAGSTRTIRVFAATVLGAVDRTEVDGIPATSVARTLVDLAGTVSARQLRKALDEAERRRCVDLGEIEDALARTARRNGRGHAAMRAALHELRTVAVSLTRSALEERFLTLLDAHGLPRPQTNASIDGMEVDFVWPRERLGVETDGWAAHATRQAFQRDRERSNELTAKGWTVLRFTHADVVARPSATAARVARALAAGRRYPPSP